MPSAGASPSPDPDRNINNTNTPYSQALGFLRTHALLIPSQLDFALALESHLLPPCIPSFAAWSAFIAPFRDIPDSLIAQRYHYGQLRLSRLNWLVRLTRPHGAGYGKWFYEVPYWDITGFVEGAAVPLVFAFAGVSLVLGAMQVVLGAGGSGGEEMESVFWGFGVAVVVAWATVLVLLVGLPLGGLAWQLGWAFRTRSGSEEPQVGTDKA